jgi:hypothetical protein
MSRSRTIAASHKPMKSFILFLLFTVTFSLCAQSPTDPRAYERLLLPVYDAEGRAGAFGSFWKTEFLVRNEGTQPVTVFHSQCVHFCTCVTIVCPPGQPLGGGEFSTGGSFSPVPPAAFLYAERSSVDTLSFNLRVFDAARSGLTMGTEVPIVRERDVKQHTTWLTNIPTDSRFRAHLRILGVASPTGEGFVRVRIYPLHGPEPLLDRVLTFLGPPLRTSGPIPRPDDTNAEQPGYAELGPLRTLLGDAVPDRIRIRVDSLTTDFAYWPYVAVTNNDTQHVTLFTPQ